MAFHVEDAHRSPYNITGVVQVLFDNNVIGWGTGALINSTTVLTCSHNLTKQGEGYVPKANAIHFYYAWNTTPFPQLGTPGGIQAECAIASARFKSGNQDWDVGLVKLSEPIESPYYMIPFTTVDESILHKELNITGFPSNKLGQMWTDTDAAEFISIDLNTLLLVVETAAGSSGSPIYQYDSLLDQIFLFAIHVARTDTNGLKRAILITEAISNWIQTALDTPCNPPSFLKYI